MADLTILEGRTYGPAVIVPTPATTTRFVAAVTEDPKRWLDAAPPSWAGAALFAVAPAFLTDPDVVAAGGGIVHADQTFTWHRPFSHDVALTVTGRVERLRMRGDTAWVTFTATATAADGPVLESVSTFVMTGPSAPATSPAPPPAVAAKGNHATTADPDGSRPVSASRADLVAYAAASGDLNPIHWDAASAHAAGLDGVVVHGLMLAAWCAHQATVDLPGDAPLASARIRFRRPVPAGAQALIRPVGDHAVKLFVGEEEAMAFTGVPVAEVTP